MTTDNRSVSDELLGATVRDATTALNRALHAAHAAGLLASVDTDEMREAGRFAPLVIVRVTVSRPL